MPAFPSFISLPRRNKNKNTKSPFDVRRRNTPTSPHPYAAVFDISHDKRVSMDSTVSTVSQGTDKRPRCPGAPEQSLGVKLDIDLSPEPITNWFPEHLLSGGEDGASGSGSGSRRRSVKQLQNSQKASTVDEDGGMYGDSEDDGTSSTSDDILANLEALDASHFVNFVGSGNNRPNRMSMLYKRTAPTPIKIPTATLHGAKVQLIRSTSTSDRRSRPTSQISSVEESSAVSGSTLARALMANSFVLSSDTRLSRHRSGASSLVRTDSATLPRGEHPFLNSPVIQDRTLSWGSQFSSSLSPASSEAVPPIPFNAELVYSPPKNPRLETNKSMDAPKRASIGGITRLSDDMDTSPSISPPCSNNMTPAALSDHHYSEPLEKINETSPVDSREFRENDANSPHASCGELASAVDVVEGVPEDIPSHPSNAANATSPIESNSDHDPSPSCSSVQHLVTPSTDASVISGKDLGDVLDYYEHSPPNDPAAESNEYRLPFSPIPEELSSQLSPPSPFKQDARPHPGGLILSTSAPSASGSGRIEWVARRDSVRSANSSSEDNGNRLSLLPIGERPRSLQFSPNASTASTHSSPSATSVTHQRTGSTRSPIKGVVRDLRDMDTYQLMVAPTGNSEYSDSTPNSSGSSYGQQTFPETPDLSSPTYSLSLESPIRSDYGQDEFPQTPASAALPRASMMPSITQQVLLTRAASSVHGARHSRQVSITRARTVAPSSDNSAFVSADARILPQFFVGGQSVPQDILSPPLPPIPDESTMDLGENVMPTVVPEPKPATPPMLHQGPSGSTLSLLSRRTGTGSSTSLGTETNSEVRLLKALPPLPPSPLPSSHSSPSPLTSVTPEILPLPSTADNQHPRSSNVDTASDLMTSHVEPPRSPSIRRTEPPPRPSPLFMPPDLPVPPPPPPAIRRNVAPPALVVPPPPPLPTLIQSRGNPPPVIHAPPALVVPPPPPLPTRSYSASPQLARPPRRVPLHVDHESDAYKALGSPPPYDTIVHNHPSMNTIQGADVRQAGFGPLSTESSSVANPNDQSSLALSPTPTVRRRTRAPAGPRGPSQPKRDRVSSVPSSNTNRRTYFAALPSPRFQTPTPKWRGYTMDAAKWTFSSAELQAIVSKAIRQSAEASSIRLLHQEAVDLEIPVEMEKLEKQRMDVKSRYKMFTRRRTELLEALSAAINDNSSRENTPLAVRHVEDLKDVSVALDRLAEDLHSIDQQIAQLSSLCDVHIASALAMALRKLNSSFLKEFAQSRVLREQLQILEAEKNEAWQQAESVAQDFDNLSERAELGSPDSQGKRFSRISAVRKSSIRMSRAGAKSTFSIEDIPPVPPIPRHRPNDIMTNLSSRISTGFSTDGFTPNTETRAMIRAHEELCDMLGITSKDLKPRRALSLIASPSNGERARTPEPRHRRRSSCDRPSSLPDSSGLSHVYKADPNGILTTLGMLSDTD
ncbi:uncharacterized protein EV420DRAFT_9410 [Desarmillaria tabescens]|uniref:Uncharacterized protein n=1 Tax=Armillaria tabescens TaxID=1929756 RepID=A0AA39TXA8_ARMTA|nr:uncharacterized protein EV420DRAFT_9410 [Desarmillaria tabescens]KAK0469123.1 hypothetical protein EV420DRAFT_9410 [Desarmillaria tabescens]